MTLRPSPVGSEAADPSASRPTPGRIEHEHPWRHPARARGATCEHWAWPARPNRRYEAWRHLCRRSGLDRARGRARMKRRPASTARGRAMTARAAFLSLAFLAGCATAARDPAPARRPRNARRCAAGGRDCQSRGIGRTVRLGACDHRHAVRVRLSRGDLRRDRGGGRAHRRLADPHAGSSAGPGLSARWPRPELRSAVRHARTGSRAATARSRTLATMRSGRSITIPQPGAPYYPAPDVRRYPEPDVGQPRPLTPYR